VDQRGQFSYKIKSDINNRLLRFFDKTHICIAVVILSENEEPTKNKFRCVFCNVGTFAYRAERVGRSNVLRTYACFRNICGAFLFHLSVCVCVCVCVI
jgi:hypothetical protein